MAGNCVGFEKSRYDQATNKSNSHDKSMSSLLYLLAFGGVWRSSQLQSTSFLTLFIRLCAWLRHGLRFAEFADLTYLFGGSMLCSVFDLFGFRLLVRSHKESVTRKYRLFRFSWLVSRAFYWALFFKFCSPAQAFVY
jgi:hypothetical protein